MTTEQKHGHQLILEHLQYRSITEFSTSNAAKKRLLSGDIAVRIYVSAKSAFTGKLRTYLALQQTTFHKKFFLNK